MVRTGDVTGENSAGKVELGGIGAGQNLCLNLEGQDHMTGPKISSRASAMSSGTSAKTVGAMKTPTSNPGTVT